MSTPDGSVKVVCDHAAGCKTLGCKHLEPHDWDKWLCGEVECEWTLNGRVIVRCVEVGR